MFSFLCLQLFTDGTTNKLVGCYIEDDPDDVVLVRVYGNKTELIVDRDNELKSFQVERRHQVTCMTTFLGCYYGMQVCPRPQPNQSAAYLFSACLLQVLHANGCAPRIYCTFLNGICYEFMQGDALGTQDVRDPSLRR